MFLLTRPMNNGDTGQRSEVMHVESADQSLEHNKALVEHFYQPIVTEIQNEKDVKLELISGQIDKYTT